MGNLETSKSFRFVEIDVMKGIAIMLVVLGHVLAWFYDDFLVRIDSMPYNEIVLWKYIYSFHMPLFMFVSGFVVFNPCKKYTLLKVGRRCTSYLIPWVTFGVICSIYREEFNIGNILGQYWYFKTLAIFLMLVFFLDTILGKVVKIQRYKNLVVPVLFSSVILGLSQICKRYGGAVDLILDSSHLDWNFFYFIVGWYLRREKNIYELCKSDWVLPICLVFMIIHFVYPKNIYVFFPLVAILFTANISQLLSDGHIKKMIISFGESTKDIYILHFFFMLKIPLIGQYFESIIGLGIAPAVVTQIFIGFPICLVITYLCYKIGKVLNRNKYVAKYCFGYI